MISKKERRRYYFHWKIRKQGLLLNSFEHTIMIGPKNAMTKQAKALVLEYKYVIQTILI